MAVYAMLSAGGAPGVTTAALALTLSWPSQVVIAECDPSGGDILAGLLSGHLPATAGLLPLALEAGAGAEVPADILWRQLVELDEEHNRLLLAGISDPRQSAALQSSLPWIAEALQGLRADVLADCGRLDAVAAVRPVLSAASLAVLVLAPTLRQVSRAIPRVEMLTNLMGPGRVVLLTVGDGATSGRELAKTLGVPVAGHLPADPKTASVLSDGLGSRRRLNERPLIRAAAAVGRGLRAAAESAGALPGFGGPAVYTPYASDQPSLDSYPPGPPPPGVDDGRPAGSPSLDAFPPAAEPAGRHAPSRPHLNGFPQAPKGPGAAAPQPSWADRSPAPPPGPDAWAPEPPDPDADRFPAALPRAGSYDDAEPDRFGGVPPQGGSYDGPDTDSFPGALPRIGSYDPERDRVGGAPPRADRYDPEPDPLAAGPPRAASYDPGQFAASPPVPEYRAAERSGWDPADAGWPTLMPYDPGSSYDPGSPYDPGSSYDPGPAYDPALSRPGELPPPRPGRPAAGPEPAWSAWDRADPAGAGQAGEDQPRTGQFRSDPHGSDPHGSDPHGSDPLGSEQFDPGPFDADQFGADQYRVFGADQYRAGPEEPGDPDGTQYGPAQNGSRP
jgi:hypothetical protein